MFIYDKKEKGECVRKEENSSVNFRMLLIFTEKLFTQLQIKTYNVVN
jgi:hypothetical protein